MLVIIDHTRSWNWIKHLYVHCRPDWWFVAGRKKKSAESMTIYDYLYRVINAVFCVYYYICHFSLVYKSVQNSCTNVKHILCIFLLVTGFFSIFYWYTERRTEQETRSCVEDKSSKGIKVKENAVHSIYSKVIFRKLLRNCDQIFLIDWKKEKKKQDKNDT